MFYLNRVFELSLLAVTVNLVSSFGNYTLPDIASHCCKQRFMNNEVRTEVQLLQTVNDALRMMRRTLNILERFFNELKSSVPDQSSKSRYLDNLSNSFSLIRRISNMWPPRLSLMKITFGRFMKTPTLCSIVNFFTDLGEVLRDIMAGKAIEDFRYYNINTSDVWRSAMTGLVRLQETYNLNTTDIAAGAATVNSEGVNNTAMSARDCFDIGVYCMEVGVPVRAVEWLLEASRQAVDHPGVSATRINEYLQVANCYMGDSRSYWKIFRTLFDEPHFIPTQDLNVRYGEMISSNCQQLKQIYIVDPHSEIINRGDMLTVVEQRGLCRKDMSSLIPADKNLRCRMIHYNQPYLRIGPLKMEEMKLDPPVLLFHEVTFETEIKTLVDETFNETKPAAFDYGPSYVRYQDTQFNYWLYKDTSNLTKVWDIKSSTIANAALHRSAAPMIASYGLAGEIRMHMDLGPDENIMNRVHSRADYITLMYWLNQPEEGGYTVFPHLELAVVPVKGSAVLWFNRHPNWDQDMNMVHTGCPILTGTKWVLTKWFHVLGQHYPKCNPGMERTRKYYYLESNNEES